jgi:hypothetical protein
MCIKPTASQKPSRIRHGQLEARVTSSNGGRRVAAQGIKKTKAVFLSIVAILSAVSAHARVDVVGPLPNFRRTDPDGIYYVVVKRDPLAKKKRFSAPFSLEIAKRQDGSAAVTNVRDSLSKTADGVVTNPEVGVRRNDILLGRVSLDVALPTILVSSTGLGIVVLDKLDDERSRASNVFACHRAL